MTADHEGRPGTLLKRIEIGIDRSLKRDRAPFRVKQCEVQWQVQARLAVSVEMADPIRLPCNSSRNAPDVFDAVHRFRPVVRKHEPAGLRGGVLSLASGSGGLSRSRSSDQHSAGINPEAIDTAL
ncbi:hypothetical protein QA639_09430 [Bradyrhizobium pachyrhizi]|nr:MULTISPECIES: hypothetical protein [Bradyrhizobium]WFU57708.1 hypothetical protein QA639_09430 [Bradyrhizobium pachyrhizi]WOH83256.1 hypothetical protein RX327_08995 [Bradyrhizobium sp. BEA-2-5]